PSKPSPDPVRLAMSRLGVESAWMIGDTPDDIVAARGASVLPIGICGDGAQSDALRQSLGRSGAARTLIQWSDIKEVLP
ncbi:MAG: HAD hydrolase-like protein, partial [Myxococcota bacterium]|nr:HAD hydrolase-like protein [Myxococcota bacterium]